MTIKCKLLCQENDIGGYVIYVFKNLDNACREFGRDYVMVTRWPNWIHKELEINEVGYLEYKEVIAGVDTWYDGTKQVPYNYSNNVFIRFVSENNNLSNNKDIIL